MFNLREAVVANEFTLNNYVEHVKHTISSIVVDENESLEEILSSRRKHRDALKGGVTIKTVIGKSGKGVTTVTSGANSINVEVEPNNFHSIFSEKKKRRNLL